MYNKRRKLKILALNSLIPYLGKIIFCASDWTAASTKNPQHGCKQIRRSYTLRSYMLLVLLTRVALSSFSLPLVSYSYKLLSIPASLSLLKDT